jgi:hypothetical protein
MPHLKTSALKLMAPVGVEGSVLAVDVLIESGCSFGDSAPVEGIVRCVVFVVCELPEVDRECVAFSLAFMVVPAVAGEIKGRVGERIVPATIASIGEEMIGAATRDGRKKPRGLAGSGG